MTCIPKHGRIDCTLCHKNNPVKFDQTRAVEGEWRITANPLAWGNNDPEVIVLGFSKGPTQAGALTNTPHDQIAYRGGRGAVGKILAHLGLIPTGDTQSLRQSVDRLIADRSGRFHFGSLIRCTVERFDRGRSAWIGSGGGMLDRFVETTFGRDIALRCATRFLAKLPPRTRLVLMFGLGNAGNYVTEARKIIELARPGAWATINPVAYTDGTATFVHVEHFASQGALLPNWLGEKPHKRATLGRLAQEAVARALQDQNASNH